MTAIAQRGSFSSGGSRGGFGSRTSSRISSWFGGRSRTSTSRTSSTRTRTSTTIIHSHYAPTRVYSGRTYIYHSGGWGYGYYGPHPYFDAWYGYPMYYSWPGHWSGWTWSWAPIIALLVIAIIAFVIWAVIDFVRGF